MHMNRRSLQVIRPVFERNGPEINHLILQLNHCVDFIQLRKFFAWLLGCIMNLVVLSVFDMLLYPPPIDAVRHLGGNDITTVAAGVFDPLTSLEYL